MQNRSLDSPSQEIGQTEQTKWDSSIIQGHKRALKPTVQSKIGQNQVIQDNDTSLESPFRFMSVGEMLMCFCNTF